MRFCSRMVLIFALLFASGVLSLASAQQVAKPLSEKEILYLLEKKVSSGALAKMVDSYGVSFQPDNAALDRLKKAGADDALLESVRRRAKLLKSGSGSGTSLPGGTESIPKGFPAQQHLELGQQKLRGHDYEGALQEFAEAEKIQPQWDQIFYQRGLTFVAQARYSEAAAEWKKYLSSAPTVADRGAILQKISEWETEATKARKTRMLLDQGDAQLQNRDTDGAAKSYGEAVRLSNSVGTLLALARVQLLERDSSPLAETAQQALALDPQSALARFYLSDAEFRRGNIVGSMGTLQQGLALNPHLAYGRALAGRALQNRAQNASGQPAEQRESGPNASSADERDRLGWALWNGGYFREGLEEFYKATALDPGEPGWQCDLAYARLAKGDSAGALASARAAVHLDSRSVCGHLALALALDSTAGHDQALGEYQEAQKLIANPEIAFLVRLIGGDTERADAKR